MRHHTSSLGRLGKLAAVAALTAGVVAVPGTANAASDVFRDARGDMAGHGADIHRVRVVNEDRIRVRVVHENLRRSWKSNSSLTVYLDTDKRRTGPEFALIGGTFEGTDYALVKTRNGWKQGRRVESKDCEYGMTLDYGKETATITMDRDCFGSPKAVRVAVKTGGELASGDIVRDWLGERRELTPWVRRG
ncbi:MAG TPA: hypothetical protein VLA97_18680 [Nocardioidaceae bacterium]|jgi:hypothetical protein|nr:hypothetical protein [Nocardioidaceae bacterium]